MIKKRKICIFTGTRAEYGLLRPLIEAVKKDKALQLQIIASGMHLSRKFGLTYREIEKDGFCIDKNINISLKSDAPLGISKSMGIAIPGMSKAYCQLKPDIIVILGDRFEAFAAAVAATICRVPLAHLYGGESTFGVIDEAQRHSISKMSHLHFTATETYRKRVIQLGEDPKKVFNVGAISLDSLVDERLLSKKDLERALKFKFNKYNLLVTFHPVTLEDNTAKQQFKNILDVLAELKDTNIIFTRANADTQGSIINALMDIYVNKHRNNTVVFTSMGRLRYLSAIQYVDAVVGNSSSGVIEAPSFKIATINIGDRQQGRIKANSILDCDPTITSINKAIRTIYTERFKNQLFKVINPYKGEDTVKKILNRLKTANLKGILKKNFYDINFKYQ